MPGRTYSIANTNYRYGFNGKENDNEVKGEGNQQDYGMRIYEGRLGRFLSADPLTKAYPMLTPYQFSSNTPIQAIDLDGLEKYVVTNYYNRYKQLFRTVISGIRDADTKAAVELSLTSSTGRRATTLEAYTTNIYADGTQRDDPASKALDKKLMAAYEKNKFNKPLEGDETPTGQPENSLVDIYEFGKGKFNSFPQDLEKNEFFSVVINNGVPKPAEEKFDSNIFRNGRNLDGSKSSSGTPSTIESNISLIEGLVKTQLATFNNKNPNAKTIFIDVTLTSTSKNMGDLKKIVKGLNKQYNINLKTDNKFKTTDTQQLRATDQDYHLKVKVSGT